MKFGHLDFLSYASTKRYSALTGFIRQAGWPTLGGLFAVVIGLALLLAAWHYDQQARTLGVSGTAGPQGPAGDAIVSRQFARATEAIFTVPEDSMHIDDLNRLFKLAKTKGVQIGTVEYRQTSNPSLQVLVRTLDIRIQEDYPKLKSFVAELLSTTPHVSLQEIRVERKDATTAQGQTLLKLAFVYRAPGTSAIQSRVAP